MLSSRLPRHRACQLLVRSSITPQASISRPSTRAFHASAPRKDPLVDAILYLPHEMMSLIHTTVPWYAALPISAFILRALLVTTAGTYARSLYARFMGLLPLRQALALQKRDEILQQRTFRTPREATLATKKELKQVTSALDKRWSTTLDAQICWTVGQIPIFFAMAETTRQKCGAQDGLLGMAMASIKGEGTTMVNESGELVARVTPSLWFDPSLANEGMLWFPDLLIPDPTGMLPFIASGLMFSNFFFTNNSPPTGAKWPTIIRRTLLFASLCIGPLCQNLPAALMLYWCSSTTSVILWNVWLDRMYPVPRGYEACKRPLLMPPAPAPKRRRI
ncbi:60KD-IMP domain containing protein [Pyrenophora tritici-repentis]|uniref:60KD-IMP domain containing protein n=2 Tax=Pyrenophora tritici-repentis TaxID=45151 RepID=A0A2W1E216_9PLEO|nr:uncharacterized protein PTRG_04302 [Pyrenophora tritici-repentis Pt-1C-BFP]KAA8619603.1 hypothetical protein PtrV1_06697 [Pyrenophora tritici-repentis]EDU47140.1 predicted protein [Pyrenophora tritici-repentis Pt-1C-BFP]KAF7447748.1 hypothetical protein A1F99_071120 [Pyrenophora tritici-repentis]KAF7571442.1 60KD-IMP domain containing protein [Pyrenophora tritici-repentis]KAG9385324.1 hypothetical protein A1F94_004871 [Pyrenophora tritici-repentis]